MKKTFKIGVLASLLLATTSSFAEVEIQNIGIREGSLKFESSLLNKKIQITPGCKSVQEVFDEIDKKIGYSVINKTNLDVEAPICSGYKFELLGDLLNAVIADMDVNFYEENDQRIVLEYSQEYSVKMPNNWDIQETLNIVKTKFPNIKTYSFGNTIRMVGNSKEMVKAKETLDRIEKWAERSLPVTINVTKLNTSYSHDKNMVISKISKMNNDKTHKINISHGIVYPLENIGSVVFDLQKNRIVLNGSKYIKLDEISSYAFFRNGYQISFDTQFGTYVY